MTSKTPIHSQDGQSLSYQTERALLPLVSFTFSLSPKVSVTSPKNVKRKADELEKEENKRLRTSQENIQPQSSLQSVLEAQGSTPSQLFIDLNRKLSQDLSQGSANDKNQPFVDLNRKFTQDSTQRLGSPFDSTQKQKIPSEDTFTSPFITPTKPATKRKIQDEASVTQQGHDANSSKLQEEESMEPPRKKIMLAPNEFFNLDTEVRQILFMKILDYLQLFKIINTMSLICKKFQTLISSQYFTNSNQTLNYLNLSCDDFTKSKITPSTLMWSKALSFFSTKFPNIFTQTRTIKIENSNNLVFCDEFVNFMIKFYNTEHLSLLKTTTCKIEGINLSPSKNLQALAKLETLNLHKFTSQHPIYELFPGLPRTLKYLDLWECYPLIDSQKLVIMTKAVTQLETLILTNQTMIGDRIFIDAQGKKNKVFQKLVNLVVRRCDRITDETIKAMKDNKALRSLDLWETKSITNQSLEVIGKNLTQLQTLILCRIDHINDEGLSFLSNLTNNNVQGDKMILDTVSTQNENNNITNPTTTNNKEMRKLVLRNCANITEDAIFKLMESGVKLKHLDLWGTGRIQTEMIFDKSKIENLTRLILAESKIDDSCLCSISQNATQLKEISLRRCEFVSTMGIRKFIILPLKNLACIDLFASCSSFGGINDDLFVPTLEKPHNKNVKELDVTSSKLTDEGVKEMIKWCNNIERIVVQKCSEIGDEGVEAIVESFNKRRYRGGWSGEGGRGEIDISSCTRVTSKSQNTIMQVSSFVTIKAAHISSFYTSPSKSNYSTPNSGFSTPIRSIPNSPNISPFKSRGFNVQEEERKSILLLKQTFNTPTSYFNTPNNSSPGHNKRTRIIAHLNKIFEGVTWYLSCGKCKKKVTEEDVKCPKCSTVFEQTSQVATEEAPDPVLKQEKKEQKIKRWKYRVQVFDHTEEIILQIWDEAGNQMMKSTAQQFSQLSEEERRQKFEELLFAGFIFVVSPKRDSGEGSGSSTTGDPAYSALEASKIDYETQCKYLMDDIQSEVEAKERRKKAKPVKLMLGATPSPIKNVSPVNVKSGHPSPVVGMSRGVSPRGTVVGRRVSDGGAKKVEEDNQFSQQYSSQGSQGWASY